MSNDTVHHHFRKMKLRFRLLRSAEILMLALAPALLCFYFLRLFPIPTVAPIGISTLVGVAIAVWGFRKLRVFNITGNDLAIYMNRQYPELEESADLLLQVEERLSPLQKLQKARAIKRFESLYPTIRLPHKIGRAAGVFVMSIVMSLLLIAFTNNGKKIFRQSKQVEKIDRIHKTWPVTIRAVDIIISPPKYTGKNQYTTHDLNLAIPENSTVQWKVVFDGEGMDPTIIFSGKDTTRLVRNEAGEFQIMRSFKETGFYQVTWKTSDSLRHQSDYYKIETIQDQAPTIAVENLNQFVELKFTDNLNVQLTSTITDDYGLSGGYVIATVSKGSGEAIKFREEKLAFDQPEKITGKKIQAKRTLDLLKLGLQPGDEIYFYLEAFDVRMPEPNRTRTETYFISLQDTSNQTTSMDAGLGVDLMPEYFRSQRQIIIDSEKLLREKKTITKKTFSSRSNELGYDQKVLRLRYGEFLGEEFASGISPQNDVASTSSEDDEDVTKEFGHAHDTDNQHNLVEEKKEPLKKFIHAHDGTEEATFFVQSIKAKLKAAVTIMWDAELYLRLYQPEKSLPYQYKALKLLKEISQDSRIYVHRTGFDPPPLKEEKRLTGDLAEIKNSTARNRNERIEVYPDIRSALIIIEKLLQKDSIILTAEARGILKKAGRELATLAIDQPGRYIQHLSLLSRLSQDELNGAQKLDALTSIRAALWNVIPQETMSPQQKPITTHELDVRFLETLGASKPNN